MNYGLKSVLVSVTEGCSVGCQHCGFIGSTREREAAPGVLSGWVKQICDSGVPLVIFTGGEPFERFEVLEDVVATCERAGVPAASFTSSYWAVDAETTRKKLNRLKGLKQLYLSSDIYHQRRVPYANVFNVIEAADAQGMGTITICLTYATEADRQEVRAQYERFGDRLRFHEDRVIPTPFLKKVVKNQDPELGFSPQEYEPTCWIDTPILNPDGYVWACHVGKVGAHGDFRDLPYWLGDMKEDKFADVMKSADSNAPYQFLRTLGPSGVAELFSTFPGLKSAVKREGFTARCDMCYSTLATVEGQSALADYVTRPEVRDRINIGRLLRYGEGPMPAPIVVKEPELA